MMASLIVLLAVKQPVESGDMVMFEMRDHEERN